MKRVLKYLIIAFTLATLVACLAGAAWLFGTTEGAKRLLDTVSLHTDLNISAEKIEGRLAGALRLENTDIQWPQGKIRIQRLELCTQPLDLLAGQLSIQNLSLRNVSISDNTPDTPPPLIWPRASGLIKFFSGKIGRMEINNLTYRHLDKQPLQFQTIVASVAWKNSRLSVSNLQMVSDLGVVQGNMLAGFNRPLFEMDLAATPSRPLAGMESFQLTGKFGPGQSAGELAGNLHLSGSQNKQTLWQMAMDASMTSEGFPLKNIRLHRPGQKGLITADGMLTVSEPAPFLTLQAQAADVDLISEFKVPTDISGSLTFAGSLKKYQGRFVLANKGKDRQSIRLASDYSGNSESVALNTIQGTALGGTLGGRLVIDWQHGLAMNGALVGRNLDPAGIDPDWTGVIHFDLSGKVSVPEQKLPSGEITCSLLQSRLHGQQLTGDLRATFADDDIRIAHLSLQGKGFQIIAQGAVMSKVDFTARISDLSRLIPQTAGSLTASGWTRWRNSRLSGVISAQARGLAANGLEIAAAGLSAALEDQETSPLSMNATFNKLRYQGFTADALTLQAKGTPAAHTLAAAVRRGRYETHLALSGAYRQGSWQGKVARLDGTDSVGLWKLVQPAALSITSNSLSFEPMMLTGRGSETLRLSGKLSGEPLTGSLALNWNDLNLDRANAWMNQEILTGTSSGNVHLNLLPRNHIDLTGHTALAQSKIHWQGQKGDVSFDLRDASLDWVWREEAFSGEITMTMSEHGKLQGRFRLPITARLPVSMNTGGSLQASLTGQLREKGALGVLFPELVQESHGDLNVDLKMSGSWAEPQLFGTVHLSKAGGYLPTAGISIKDARIAARLAQNKIYIDSFRAVSGPGYIDGSAVIRMKGMQVEGYEGRINGERFQAIYFPELQVQSSPMLTFAGTAEKISVRGEVLLPEVQIIGSQSRGPVEASPDVIREGKTKPAAQKLPVNLDVQVKMILGDQVQFKASGIDAQLGGQINLQFQNLDRITGRGEIRVVKGRFRTYGVNLDIVRGRLFYAGGPINQPVLDILAWRKVGDIRAGVMVSGALLNPLVKLYSEPFMQDMGILAYIVLGHPLGSNSEQANLMVMAAGALLTSRQSEEVQRQIKNRLGFDTFDISADVVTQNGYMGYKRINATPAGTNGINSAGNVSETMLVVGKYLTPKLYISYGRSLFSGGNLFFLRYDISKNWQIETQTGQESGVDIYYKLEFN